MVTTPLIFQTPLQSSLSKTEVSDSSLDLCSSFTYFLYDSDTFYLGSYTYRDLSLPFRRLKYFLSSHFNKFIRHDYAVCHWSCPPMNEMIPFPKSLSAQPI